MILIVQPCTVYLRHIRESLTHAGHQVTSVQSYDDACEVLRYQSVELVLLDVELGERSGFALCREIRQQRLASSVIFVSAESSTADRILALEMGADDFICYPCQSRELQARVTVQLRHLKEKTVGMSGNMAHGSQIRCGSITIDDTRHQIWVRGQPLYLTATEYTLLRFLALHPEQVFSRLQLLEAVWGYQHSGYEHTVVSHISRLRNKLAGDVHTRIATVWGVGYKLTLATRPRNDATTSAVVPLRQSI